VAVDLVAVEKAHLKRIDADRLGDALQCLWAEVVHREVQPGAHLTVGVFGEAGACGMTHA